jgi:hypothetical protein
MKSTLVTLPAILAAVVGLAAPGCGPEAPIHDPATRYTPESLAQELVFRFNALKPGAKALSKGGPVKKDKEAEARAQTKSKEPTKQAADPTLDGLLAEIDAKARLVSGTTRPETLKKVSSLVAAHPSVTGADKRLLAEGMGRLADAP